MKKQVHEFTDHTVFFEFQHAVDREGSVAIGFGGPDVVTGVHLDRHLHDLALCQIFHAEGVGIVTFGKMTCSRKQCDSAFR